MPVDRNLLLRVASALVGLPLIGALVLWREPLGFGLFSLAIVALALVEYTSLTLPGRAAGERAVVVLIGTAFAGAVYLRPQLALAWALLALMAVGLLTLVRTDEDMEAAAGRLTRAGFGIFYVGGLLVALPLIHRDVPDGRFWVVLAITATFANDTGAYFAGRAFGRHKLAATISPKKSVEGAVGGAVASLAMALVARATFVPGMTLTDALVIGAGASVLGPAGDLIESLLKRAAGAKDSGRLIPGHGGVLDRVDALLLVGAFVYAYLQLTV